MLTLNPPRPSIRTIRTFLVVALLVACPLLLQACGASRDEGGDASAIEASLPPPQTPIVGLVLSANPNVKLGVPAGGTGAVLLSRSPYVLSWNTRTRLLNWAAWSLSAADLGTTPRQDTFAVDAQLKSFLARSGSRVQALDGRSFQESCLDRGHQVPSADRTASEDSNNATFFMSNMVPQTSFLNRTAWGHMEDYERDLVRGTAQTVYLLAGPVFPPTPHKIGAAKDIPVPAKIFKIIYKAGAQGRKPEVLAAVLMPNTTSTGSDPVDDHTRECGDQRATPSSGSTDDWKRFSASVHDIEVQSGLSFAFLK